MRLRSAEGGYAPQSEQQRSAPGSVGCARARVHRWLALQLPSLLRWGSLLLVVGHNMCLYGGIQGVWHTYCLLYISHHASVLVLNDLSGCP